MKLFEMTAHELRDVMDRKEASAHDVARAHFEHIQAIEPSIDAVVTMTEDLALKQALQVDQRRLAGELLPALAGIPMGVKDNISTKGIRTTCCSKMLESYVPTYDAHVIEVLNALGSVMMGKLNMDEFAMGSSTETSYFKTTKNPWNTDYVPGGSSGGSAAAVAARELVFSLASDTGGSIRQPAALCGLVGLKPSYGRVSRYGLIASASSLDQMGLLTRDVEDASLVLQAMAGRDKKDSTSLDRPVPDYAANLNQDIRGLKIGVPKEYFGGDLDKEMLEKIRQAISSFESLGAEVEECSMPHADYGLAAYQILAAAEASSNMSRYDGVRYGYRNKEADDVLSMYTRSRAEGLGHEVKKRIMLGTYVLSADQYDIYYLKAQKVRRLVKEDFDKAFKKYDILLTPTTRGPAFKFGAKTEDAMGMYESDRCTVGINLAGVAAMSLPCGFVQGLPVGLQLVAAPFAEENLIKAGHAFERATDFHKMSPDLGVKA